MTEPRSWEQIRPDKPGRTLWRGQSGQKGVVEGRRETPGSENAEKPDHPPPPAGGVGPADPGSTSEILVQKRAELGRAETLGRSSSSENPFSMI